MLQIVHYNIPDILCLSFFIPPASGLISIRILRIDAAGDMIPAGVSALLLIVHYSVIGECIAISLTTFLHFVKIHPIFKDAIIIDFICYYFHFTFTPLAPGAG
jgi:hypothetical protein